ncbi:MAG: hypothetical protein GC166_04785 [Alphaproteobacteria bacterium]|nr:hypothetical protein [Alphaproteobacteria bacterium]
MNRIAKCGLAAAAVLGALVVGGAAFASGSVAPSGGDMAQQPGNTISSTYNVDFAHDLGFQVDGLIGHVSHEDVFSIGGHFFWDGDVGLFGGYANYTHFSNSVETMRFALQTVLESGDFMFAGQGGYEGGDIKSDFYDIADVSYFPNDDWRVFVGHRRTQGKNAVAFGGEYLMPFEFFGAAPFLEGRAGNKENTGFWGGIRFYFGHEGESLQKIHGQGTVPVDPIESVFPGLNRKPKPQCQDYYEEYYISEAPPNYCEYPG